MSQEIPLSKGETRSLAEGQTKFLGKLIDIFLSATKKAASKRMINRMTDLLTAAGAFPVRGEHKVWFYRNYDNFFTTFLFMC